MGASPPLVSPGEVLDGKYAVERILGEGGMGLVVAATHVVLKTRVAIKVLLPEATRDPDTVTRFHREARSAVRLRSPHAGRVHDVGQLANGTPYMVMDLLAGRDLDRLLTERGTLGVTEVVGYMLQALQALEEAHSLGIIHRDIKPANFFLAEQPSGPPIVKVLDFGIARDFHEGNEQRLTRTRAVMGSPTYMSPEQMREARSADARSDIWSLGVCMYELLTGKPPFNAATLPDLFVTVLHGTPVPPDTLRPEVPPGLSAIVLRCLEKDPAQRYPSAAELARALTPYASEATWPLGDHRSSARVVVVPNGSSPTLPRLSSAERLATSRTLTDASPSPQRSGIKVAWVAVLVCGALGVLLAGGALAMRARTHAAEVAAAAAAATTEQPATPLPPDLSTAGGAMPVPPPTGAGPAAPASASSSAAQAAAKGAGRAARPQTTTTPPAPPSPTPPAVTTPPVVVPPPQPPPPSPPKFDPGSNF